MANLSVTEAQGYAIEQKSDGDCWQAAMAMAINMQRRNPKLVSLSVLVQAVSTFTKAKPDWASPSTWGKIATELGHRCAVNLECKTTTEFALDSYSLAARMVEALNKCATLILTLHNNSGGYHDVVIAGYEGGGPFGLQTRFVMVDPATGNASSVTLNSLWSQGIAWVSVAWRLRGG